MATAEFTVTLVDFPEVRELINACYALDDNIAEFGIDHPEYISETYQRWHDTLHTFNRAGAVVRCRS